MRKQTSWMWATLAALGLGSTLASAIPGGLATAEEGSAACVEDLVGTWLFVEDRSPESNAETARMRPPAGARFSIALEDGAVVLQMLRGGKPYVTRYPLDGSESVITEQGATRTARGRFEEGAWRTSMRIDAPGRAPDRREVTESTLTVASTSEGVVVTKAITSPIQIVRLSGAWVGQHEGASSEERWGPPGGGALLGTAKTVAGGKMVMFEFLRIVERGEGLVYIAQPGGASPTEFVLTQISATRAVFENPQHDYPQRIVYEREGERGLMTEISDLEGQRAHRAHYTRE